MHLHILEDEGTDLQIRPDLHPDSVGVTVIVVDGGAGFEGYVYINENARCPGLARRLSHLTNPTPRRIDGLVLSATKDGERGIFACKGDIIPNEYQSPYVCGVIYDRNHLAVVRAYRDDAEKQAKVQEVAAGL